MNNGIWLSTDSLVSTAFTDDQQDKLWDIEDGSWWFYYRAEVIIEMMDRYFHKSKLTFDIGGGNGYTSSVAERKGYRTGIIEPSIDACRHAMM